MKTKRRAAVPATVFAWVVLAGLCLPSFAQAQKKTDGGQMAARAMPQLFVLGDSVVTDEWPAIGETVSPPQDRRQVEPGQCLRFGALFTGARRAAQVKGARMGFEVALDKTPEKFADKPLDKTKILKPDGAGTLAVYPGKWCVKDEAKDATATITAVVTTADGRQVKLGPRKIAVKTFATARKDGGDLADAGALGEWMKKYHMAPDPARLLPAMRMIVAEPGLREAANSMQFLVSAYKRNPVAAAEMRDRLVDEDTRMQIYGLAVLKAAGYSTAPLAGRLSTDDKYRLMELGLEDAYDTQPDRGLGGRMDQLWSIFFATGKIEPLRKLTELLAWQGEYEKLQAIKKSGKKPPMTAGTRRGIFYSVAGWSLGAIAQEDGLAADYLDAIRRSPETNAVVRYQLEHLDGNPAFNYPHE
ncbi:MAG: hypothetical protein GC185_00600 [Alphaproteobacteria bacterium]|nr:hypothetical protein [Alphaproteobacteria bacterium]